MNKLYSTTVGSGTVPHIGHGPAHNITPGTFPGAHSKSEMRTREGDGAIILNPEDFSVSIGIQSSVVSVTTSATPLPAEPLEYRRALVIHNNSASTIYLGNSAVTVAAGFPLLTGEKIAFDIQNNPNVVVYAIADATLEVRVMELA